MLEFYYMNKRYVRPWAISSPGNFVVCSLVGLFSASQGGHILATRMIDICFFILQVPRVENFKVRKK